MDNVCFAIKMACASAVAFFAYIFGGADAILWTLIVLTVIDYLTGIIKGVCTRSLDSSVMWRGGFKKLLIYVVVALSVMIDRSIGTPSPVFRGLTIGYYISTEGLSILENVSVCGVPLPAGLTDILKKMRTGGLQ